MKNRLALILISLITTSSVLANSQTEANNLEQVFLLAQQNDPQYQQDTFDYYDQRQNLPIARAKYLPTIAIKGSASDTNTAGTKTQPTSFSTTVSQPIFNLNIWHSIREASSVAQAAKANYKANQQALITRVVTAYFKVLNDKRAIQSLITQNKALLEASKTQNIEKISGEGTIQAAAQAKADLAQSQATTIAAKTQLAIDKRALYALTNSIAHSNLSSNYSLMDVDSFNKDKSALPSLTRIFNKTEDILSQSKSMDWDLYRQEQIALTQSNSPTILAQQFTAKAAQQTLTAQTSQWIPSIEASATYTNGNTPPSTGPDTYTTNMNLSLTFTPFAGGGMIATRKQDSYKYKSALELLRQKNISALNTTKQELDTLKSQAEKIDADIQSITSSNAAYEVEKSTFAEGLTNQLGLLQAISSQTTATTNYYQDIYNYLQAYILLKQSTGTLNSADLKTLDTLLKNPTQA